MLLFSVNNLSTRLQGITTKFVGCIPRSLKLRSIVLGRILIYRRSVIERMLSGGQRPYLFNEINNVFALRKSSTPSGLIWDTNMAGRHFIVYGHQHGGCNVICISSITPNGSLSIYYKIQPDSGEWGLEDTNKLNFNISKPVYSLCSNLHKLFSC